MTETTDLNQLFTIASEAHQQGKFLQAESIYKQLLQIGPRHFEVLRLLGIVCSQQDKNSEAVTFLTEATGLNPKNPVLYMDLAEVYRRNGDNKSATESYQKVLEITPDFAQAHYFLANMLTESGNYNRAIEHYQRSIELNPNHFLSYYKLGNAQTELGQFKSAMENYRLSLKINPNFAEAHNNLGIALKLFDQTDEAISNYLRAIYLKPDFIEAHRNIAIAYEVQGKMEEAKKHYRKILESDPDNQLIRLHIESRSSVIPSGNDEIDSFHDNLLKVLEEISQIDFKIDLQKLNKSGGQPPSMLNYHGRDPRPLKKKYAEIFKDKIHAVGNGQARSGHENSTNTQTGLMNQPPASPLPPLSSSDLVRSSIGLNQSKMDLGVGPSRHPKIGFIVTSGHEGVFSKCMKGIINNLSTEKFNITIIFNFASGEPFIKSAVTNPAIEFLNLPNRFDLAVESISKENFDILYYWEVGSDTINYFLPYFGLAPVQCSGWGWPVTTFIPQMSHFLSSELLETEESGNYYSEKLIRFKHLPVYYSRPSLSKNAKTRNNFGFEENAHIYFCGQNLRKVHPDQDRLIAEILRRDPQGIVLFVGDKQANITNLLINRLSSNYPDVADRIHFLPTLSYDDFLAVTAMADVILDSLYHNGVNTTYDSLALGMPVVTLPWKFNIGRYTYAAYRQMNVTDCVAENEEDYINKAVKLAAEPEYRQAIKDKILANCSVLFEDMSAVEELSEFFLEITSSPFLTSVRHSPSP
jgi:protein O-GlcNAc transferase